MVETVKGAATEHGLVATFKGVNFTPHHLPLLDIMKSASIRSTGNIKLLSVWSDMVIGINGT
jgi:hypothetical protein